METNITFIRHAQSDLSVLDDLSRPLTENGMRDARKLCLSLRSNFDHIFSSPAKRAIDTVKPLAEMSNQEIVIVEGFMERKIGKWVDDFKEFAHRQWSDFNYKPAGGESLAETQKRNINALEVILLKCRGNSIVVGTHGTALSTILNRYDPSFGYNAFLSMVDKMPLMVKMVFNHEKMKKYVIAE